MITMLDKRIGKALAIAVQSAMQVVSSAGRATVNGNVVTVPGTKIDFNRQLAVTVIMQMHHQGLCPVDLDSPSGHAALVIIASTSPPLRLSTTMVSLVPRQWLGVYQAASHVLNRQKPTEGKRSPVERHSLKNQQERDRVQRQQRQQELRDRRARRKQNFIPSTWLRND